MLVFFRAFGVLFHVKQCCEPYIGVSRETVLCLGPKRTQRLICSVMIAFVLLDKYNLRILIQQNCKILVE